MSNVCRPVKSRLRHIVLIGLAVVSIRLFNIPPASAQAPSFTETSCQQYTDGVARLYNAAFGRQPESAGFDYWLDQYMTATHTLPSMAAFFAGSAEFDATYGALNDGEFVEQLYRNVLGRAGDAEGVDFWAGQLSTGLSRGDILLRFSESPENVTVSGTIEPALGYYNVGHEGPFVCLLPDGDHVIAPGGDVQCYSASGGIECYSIHRTRSFASEPRLDDCQQMAITVGRSGRTGWRCAYLVFDHAVEDYATILDEPTMVYVANPTADRLVVTCRLDATEVVCNNWDIFGFRIENNQVETFGFS